MIKIGSKAPSFNLIASDGKKYSLKDFSGKKIVLYFYPKDDTSGCTKEACDFRDNIDSFKKENTIVLGISADGIDKHNKFIKKYDLNFLLLSDEMKNILKKYNVWKEKSMYGRKYFGIERTTFIINEKGIIKNIFNKVKVDGHVEEVLNQIKR
ncbi:MAG: thioredoxin-dependent thiol peroxidase [Bacteroidota bacterium]